MRMFGKQVNLNSELSKNEKNLLYRYNQQMGSKQCQKTLFKAPRFRKMCFDYFSGTNMVGDILRSKRDFLTKILIIRDLEKVRMHSISHVFTGKARKSNRKASPPIEND